MAETDIYKRTNENYNNCLVSANRMWNEKKINTSEYELRINACGFRKTVGKGYDYVTSFFKDAWETGLKKEKEILTVGKMIVTKSPVINNDRKNIQVVATKTGEFISSGFYAMVGTAVVVLLLVVFVKTFATKLAT